ncbi:hypothetical protein Hanom_Chr15g01398661 [Helianthus anomalus]
MKIMVQAMVENQRQLEVKLFHNQAAYLSDPQAEYAEMFSSLMTGLNNCLITHALRTEPVICKTASTLFGTLQK